MSVTSATETVPAIEARSVYRFFHVGDQETQALRGVSMAIAPGEVVAVTGPSGSGKSTLLGCLAGLDDPQGGVVLVAGERMSRRAEVERASLRARRIGLLFQQDNLWDHLTVAENIDMARRLAGNSHFAESPSLLARLGIEGRGHAYPSQLSGGELARAGLAVALANDPVVVLADEPTGELDSATAASVLDLLEERASTGCAVVIVTHAVAVAERAQRRIRLRDGQVQ